MWWRNGGKFWLLVLHNHNTIGINRNMYLNFFSSIHFIIRGRWRVCHGPETLICLYPVAPQLSPLAINVTFLSPKSTSSFPSARFTSLFLPSYQVSSPHEI